MCLDSNRPHSLERNQFPIRAVSHQFPHIPSGWNAVAVKFPGGWNSTARKNNPSSLLGKPLPGNIFKWFLSCVLLVRPCCAGEPDSGTAEEFVVQRLKLARELGPPVGSQEQINRGEHKGAIEVTEGWSPRQCPHPQQKSHSLRAEAQLGRKEPKGAIQSSPFPQRAWPWIRSDWREDPLYM